MLSTCQVSIVTRGNVSSTCQASATVMCQVGVIATC